MQEALLVGNQVLLIYIYIAIGIVCVKKQIVTQEIGKNLSSFVLMVITPCLIIKSYIRPFEKAHLLGLALAFLLAFIFHGIAIIVSNFLIKKREGIRYKIERMGVVYTNCGFMAIPLIVVAVGDIGIFYAVAFISVFNMALWTHGIMVITDRRSINLKSAIWNPGVIGFIIGFIIYCTQLHIPDLIDQGVTSLSQLNTPLAMIITGIFLAEINFKSVFKNYNIAYVSGIRLFILPLIMLIIIKILGVEYWMTGAADVIMASILACSAPAAASIALLPAKFGMEGEYGAKIVALSTLLSIITLPLFNLLTNLWVRG
ncbi:AEC family transporter [Cellulosilyticum sp. I15G10I2]|uniref:AEC family transporter n=1 Tax=Cellulosilyticum sp. I15G10I2 TaxID=1892843 RepID=UPI00085C8D89|nr:AEC family transporter [Cellulosilyticum sp. I15G10I2]